MNSVKYRLIFILLLLVSIAIIGLYLVPRYVQADSLLALAPAQVREKVSARFLQPHQLAILQHLLQGIVVISGVSLGLLIWYWQRFHDKWKRMTSASRTMFANAKADFRCPARQLRLLRNGYIIAASFTYIFLAYTHPIIYDEAFTWLNFTRNGFAISWSFYPAPNNHVLYSLASCLTSLVPLPEPLDFRLPSVISAIFGLYLIYAIINRRFGPRFAIFGMVLWSGLNGILAYSFVARGYALSHTCMLGLIYLYPMCLPVRPKINWALFFLVAIIGLFTIPTFLYVLAICLIGLAWEFYRQSQLTQLAIRLAMFGIPAAISVCLLYSPVILFNGLDALIHNRYVVPIGRTAVLERMPLQLQSIIQFVIGDGNLFVFWISLVLLAVYVVTAIAISFRPMGESSLNHQRPERLVIGILLFSPLIIMPLHGVLAWPRTFVFTGIGFVWAVVEVHHWIDSHFKQYQWYQPSVIVAPFVICFLVQSGSFATISKGYGSSFELFIRNVALEAQQQNIHHFNLKKDIPDVILRYYYARMQMEIFIHNDIQNAVISAPSVTLNCIEMPRTASTLGEYFQCSCTDLKDN
jgi:hypothetical protein